MVSVGFYFHSGKLFITLVLIMNRQPRHHLWKKQFFSWCSCEIYLLNYFQTSCMWVIKNTIGVLDFISLYLILVCLFSLHTGFIFFCKYILAAMRDLTVPRPTLNCQPQKTESIVSVFQVLWGWGEVGNMFLTYFLYRNCPHGETVHSYWQGLAHLPIPLWWL